MVDAVALSYETPKNAAAQRSPLTSENNAARRRNSACQGTTSRASCGEKGHDFSRGVHSPKHTAALAAEVSGAEAPNQTKGVQM